MSKSKRIVFNLSINGLKKGEEEEDALQTPPQPAHRPTTRSPSDRPTAYYKHIKTVKLQSTYLVITANTKIRKCYLLLYCIKELILE